MFIREWERDETAGKENGVKSYACRQSICRVSGVKTCSNGIKKFVGITVKIEKYIHDGAGSEIHDAN